MSAVTAAVERHIRHGTGFAYGQLARTAGLRSGGGRVTVEPPFVAPSGPAAGRPYTILVADDDPGSRQALAGVLAGQGFAAVEAASGEEAIDIVRVELIHLVFFDMHMPRMTGLEAFQQVRLINELLPAILVSADVTRELMRQAHQAQVYSVIPKPVNKNVVLHTLTRALQRLYGPPADPPPVPPAAGSGPAR